MLFTPSQEEALTLDRHLCVTANAGSGKTMVLVERYLRIVCSGKAPVAEVVAVTFTEKAASELRRKVAEGIARRLETETDPAQRRLLESIRSQIPSSFISTIHGFCSRILKEYPVEAHVDAAFNVLEGIDQEFLKQECIQEVFLEILLKDGDTKVKTSAVNLLRRAGKDPVVKTVKRLLDKRELMDTLLGQDGLYNKSDNEILDLWRSAIDGIVQSDLNTTDLRNDLVLLVQSGRGKDVPLAKTLLERFAKAPSSGERGATLLELTSLMLTQKGTIKVKFGGDTSSASDAPENQAARRVTEICEALKPFLGFLDPATPAVEHTQLLERTRTLLEIYQRVTERYEEKKLDAGQLDFDDLQIKMRNLLRTEHVRARLAKRFSFVMVDEYQDTNTLQYEIILSLLDDLKDGNLFIVGDPKQSIYGFRDADVTVFEKTADRIVAAGGKRVILAESFRPLQNVAASVNYFFASIMNAGSDPHEVAYQSIIHARQNSTAGSVEVLLNDATHETSQSEMVAARIAQLIAGKTTVFDKTEQARPAMYRDVAILLRSRTNLQELENALVKNNLPYVVTAGVGYYQTQDIYDFYNYFSFLLNPGNDIALAGILRSPFFSVSDTELFEASTAEQSGSLWERIQGASQSGTNIFRAIDMLKEDRETGLRLTVSELIHRIVRRTSYRAMISALPRGDQCLANLRKLRRLAIMFESRGWMTLYDFVERLKQLIEEQEKEGQGAIDVYGNAVQIMTVHAAKGLEFPIVVVPGLERPFMKEHEPFLDPSYGIAFSSRMGDEEEDSELPPVGEFLKQRMEKRALAEEKRVFYVACTRARDHLILAGTEGTRASWLKWLSRTMEIGTARTAGHFDFLSPLEFMVIEDGVYRGGSINRDVRIAFPVVEPVTAPSALASLAHSEGPYRIHTEPILQSPRGEIFSVTGLRLFRQCSSLYFLQRTLGVPSMLSARTGNNFHAREKDSQPSGAELGSLFHSIMQSIDGVSEAGIETHIDSVIGNHGAEKPYRDALRKAVLGVLASPHWKDVAAGTDVRTEFPITVACGSEYLSGTIDRLYKDGDEIWNILDFKTDHVSGGDVSILAGEYGPQLDLYALLVGKFFGAIRLKATLLFTGSVESPVLRTYGEADLRRIEMTAVEDIARIRAGDIPDKTPCKSCPFVPIGCHHLLARSRQSNNI